MPTFDYQAVDTAGKQQRGVLEGDSARQVRQLLRQKGLMPLEVADTKSNSSVDGLPRLGGKSNGTRLGPTVLATVTRQMAVLLQSGMPLEAVLEAVSSQAVARKAQRVMSVVRGSVREGYSLSDSLAQFPNSFNRLYRSTVAAGEHAGHLDQVLEQLADYTESQRAFRQQTLSALVYPVLLVLLSVAIVTGLMIYIVPDVINVFSDTGQALPPLTLGLIALSDFLQQWGVMLFVAIALAVIGMAVGLRVPSFRYRVHRLFLHCPGVRIFSRGLNAERYIHTLGILSRSGVTLHEGMTIAQEVVDNDFLRGELAQVTQRVHEGESLNKSLADIGYFPPIMVHMLASGEASGELDKMLIKAAGQQQQDLRALVATAVSLFEPLMLVTMGGVVLLIVLAILLPILNMNQLIG